MELHPMSISRSFFRSLRRYVFAAGLLIAALFAGRQGHAQNASEKSVASSSTSAAQAWKEVQKAGQPPMPPAEWQTNRPNEDHIKEFPRRDEGYQLLLQVATSADETKAREIAKEIAAKALSDELKSAAEGLLKKFEALGKPLDIHFTAVDGREVDLKKLKGKVV